MHFSWAPDKASSNARKHRVEFADAASVFADPLALVVEDSVHPERAAIIGTSLTSQLLYVVFVEVAEDRVRLISARRATPHERKRYEEGD